MANTYSHIITCCNTGRFLSKFGLVLFDESTKKFAFIDLEHELLDFSKITGYTAIQKVGNEYYIGVQGKLSGVLKLDENLNIVNFVTLTQYYDIHSMDYYNGHLYFAASATNQVIKLDINTFEESVHWTARNNQRKLHLNVVKFYNDKMFVLLHDHFDNIDDLSKLGLLYNVTDNKEIICNLKHPHDIFFEKNYVYVSDSAKGRVFSYNFDTSSENKVFEVDGYYTRGLDLSNDTIISGISAKRIISRKQGEVLRYFKGSFTEYINSDQHYSYVHLFDKQSNQSTFIDFSHIASEIYEIKPITVATPRILKKAQIKKSVVQKWVLDNARVE